ncbi:MAG: isoleucine--tRNA ligase [Planctomycetes bacterium]|jgi:isoleucyl-tRNA synthetase|nr:isoleucine--tRNA ligase [Planctomycetota bacterium]
MTAQNANGKHYPEVPALANFPQLEREVLDRWQRDGTFQRSIDQRAAGANEFVFYDGPPFANGLPHYGHLLTGFVKDVVPRYQTMRGRRVERRFGWDCHGLPAEMEAEKELGLSGAQAVQSIGLEKYNDACRKSVQRYTQEWRSYVTRQARWVDFDRDYKTMDLSYMESVLWAFKTLHQKGLVYEGQRVMAYSWALQTPVSNFETRIDDATRPRQDPAITVAFTLQPRAGDASLGGGGPLRILVWTTTPWTLPSNLALAVGPEIDYAIVQKGDVRYVIGAATVAGYKKELDGFETVGTLKGKDLVGRTYEPLFPYFRGHANSFRILAGDFVDTAEGTGVVHMAPGFGEDDQKVCEANGIELVCPVDDRGRYTDAVPDWQGTLVFDANKDIIKVLKERGVLLRHVTYEHNYPHCWRTREPLIYKAIPGAWFVKVTAIKDRMIAHNRTIRWIPEHVRDGQFGKWLENARDWSISRNRFWGAPIPVWKSDDPKYPRTDVYGSIAELERDFGVKVPDLHRPFIDSLVRKNPDDPTGKSMMRRVPEVLDCWFESGSMPFAQVHYPFENKQWFESHFPADFIVEYVAQTRGWFYTLVVLATGLFDKPPFQNVICHGVVLDEHGAKLSKSLRNYPDPQELFEKTGADALRWFLLSSPILRGGDLQIAKDGKQIQEVVRLVLNPIWNAYYFFTLYANADGVKARLRGDQTAVLDRYALGKTRAMVEGVQRCMDQYDLAGSCQLVLQYLDALNNWYIRRSRERFWGETGPADRQDAYDTLYTCLVTLCQAAAPLLPMLCEKVYQGLTGQTSVHLADWPDVSKLPLDGQLLAQMDRVRDACSVGLSLREAKKLRTRLPLPKVTLAGADAAAMAPFVHLLQDEINVKQVAFANDITTFGSFRLQIDAKALGPKLGAKMKDVLAATRSGAWKLVGARAEIGGAVLEQGEFVLQLVPKEGFTAAALSTNDVVLVLDTALTAELEAEGVRNDFVRLVQQARKDAGLHVSDRIALSFETDDETAAVLLQHADYVKAQVLATAMTRVPAIGGEAAAAKVGSGDGKPVRILVQKG